MGTYGCDPLLGPGSIAGGHPVHTTSLFHQNLERFKLELSLLNWDNVLAQTDVDLAYEAFWNIYLENYNRTFALKRLRFNKNINKRQNFITRGILVSRKTKQVLHKKAIGPSAENIAKYKNFKTIYQRVIRAAKKLYFTSKLESNADNPKKTWETLNEILGKSKGSVNVDRVNIDGTPSSNPLEIANHFNKFFTLVGQQISDRVAPVDKNAEDYINYNRPVPDLLLQNTTAEHARKTIKTLSQKKNSNDAQGVSTKMIKYIGNEISIPLAHIFNLSLSMGVFPSKLKLCRVVPIFKSGNNMECDNYRPISLLSSISKILEKIVADKLVTHLTSNDLLYVHQYGFLQKNLQNIIYSMLLTISPTP